MIPSLVWWVSPWGCLALLPRPRRPELLFPGGHSDTPQLPNSLGSSEGETLHSAGCLSSTGAAALPPWVEFLYGGFESPSLSLSLFPSRVSKRDFHQLGAPLGLSWIYGPFGMEASIFVSCNTSFCSLRPYFWPCQ